MPNNTKAHCNGCLGERNHEVLFENQSSEEIVFLKQNNYCYTKHELLKCLGCEHIVLRISKWVNAPVDEDGKSTISYQYYPPSISHAKPEWFRERLQRRDFYKENSETPSSDYLCDLLDEIYISLENNSIRLATLGIRALLEHIMIQEVEDNGSFVENLEAFKIAGYISSSQNSILKAVLEVGHATMHRSFSPSIVDLSTCIEITENLIATIYYHPQKADRLKQKIPPRIKKKGPSSIEQ